MQRLRLLFIIAACFIGANAFAQKDTLRGTFLKPNNNRGIIYNGIKPLKELYNPISDTTFVPDQPGAVVMRPDDTAAHNGITYIWNGVKWELNGSGSIDTSLFVLRQTLSPTATITGGTTLELMASGADLTYTANWSAGRQAATTTSNATASISSIVVDGVSQSFTNPAAGATVSGTKSITVVRNTNKTVTNTVTTADSKTASATTTWAFLPKRYFGFVSTTSPADATIQALTNEFVSSRTKSTSSTLSPTGSQYFTIGFPASLDGSNVSQIWIGGIDQTASFTRSTRTFVNASGYSQSYIFYISNSTTSGDISFEIK